MSVCSFPIPVPMRAIWFFIVFPVILEIFLHTCVNVSPLFCFSGLPITQAVTPSASAAFIFSRNPPVLPLSFVTRYFISNCLISAQFISNEKGPCIAMICFPQIPFFSQRERLSNTGNTRTNRRSFNASFLLYVARSLLPVVSRMFPSVEFKKSAHSVASLHSITSERFSCIVSLFNAISEVSLCSRIYGISVFFRLSLIFSETAVANGCVASTTAATSLCVMNFCISSRSILPL